MPATERRAMRRPPTGAAFGGRSHGSGAAERAGELDETTLRPTATVAFRLGALGSLLFATVLTVAGFNLWLVSSIQDLFAWQSVRARGPAIGYQLAYIGERLATAEPGPAREDLRIQLESALTRAEQRFAALVSGDPAEGLTADIDEALVATVREPREQFENHIKPTLRRIAATAPEDPEQVRAQLVRATNDFIRESNEGVQASQRLVAERVRWFRALQVASAIVSGLVLGAVLYVGRDVVARVRVLAATAGRIAQGDLGHRVPVAGKDEVAVLGTALTSMTESLRDRIEAEAKARERIEGLLVGVREAVNQLAAASTEIETATRQQASVFQQQASAVYETLSAADQVARTSEQVAGRAKNVADSAQHSEVVGRQGRKAIEQTVSVLGAAKQQSDSIAASIVSLAERTQTIDAIAGTIEDIADQTNILALNAAIEAGRAGDQGRGFSVVAAEVRALADQAKRATVQVRDILGEIQKMASRAALATEEGTRSMTAAVDALAQAGDTLRALLDAIGEWSETATSIAHATGQQAVGLGQINQAIKNINEATSRNLASSKEMERSVRDLGAQASKLKNLLVEGEG